MGFMKPKTPSGPSAAELQAQQEAAAKRERERLQAEQTAQEQQKKDETAKAMQDKESRRKAFSASLAAEDEDESQRKKFLQGV